MPDYFTMISEILEVASKVLNEWECDFIENVSGLRTFSPKQKAVIEKIYEKVCEKSSK